MQLWHPKLKKAIEVPDHTAEVLKKSGWTEDVPKSQQTDAATEEAK